jgi:hypothetical protein
MDSDKKLKLVEIMDIIKREKQLLERYLMESMN